MQQNNKGAATNIKRNGTNQAEAVLIARWEAACLFRHKDSKSCKGMTWLFASQRKTNFISSAEESISVIWALSSAAFIQQTFTVYFHSGLLLLRLLLQALPRSAGVNHLYINEKCNCCIRFLNMHVSRRPVSSDFVLLPTVTWWSAEQ